MKYIFVILAMFSLSIDSFAQDTIWRQKSHSIIGYANGTLGSSAHDSITFYYSDAREGLPEWMPFNREYYYVLAQTYQYDSMIHWNLLSPNSWYKIDGKSQTFDAAGNLASLTIYTISSFGYENDQRYLYTYGASGNRLTEIGQDWHNNAWRNGSRRTFTYNANGDLIEDLTEQYNSTSGVWGNYYKRSYTYNGGNLTEELREEWHSMGVWEPKQKFLYSYSGGLLADKIIQKWNTGYLVFDNQEKHTYSYTNNDLIADTIQNWNSTTNQWYNVDLYTFSYNTVHQPLDLVLYRWDYGSSTWTNFLKTIYAYNPDTLLDYYEDMQWSFSSNAWEYPNSAKRYNYFYEKYTPSVTGVENTEKHNVVLSAYPNPVVNALSLKADWKMEQAFTVGIYDVNGRILKQWHEQPTKQYEKSILVTDFPAGSYYIVIGGDKEKVIRQFTVIQ